jgi:1-acyl-sn-glycerol-3-phosphate acyltransferase
MQRKILTWIIKLLLTLLSRRDVAGVENIPPSGGLILAPNHLSMLDAPLIVISIQRQDITAMAADKHRKNPFLRWLIEAMDGIWLNREEADSQAIRAAIDYLKRGHVLGIAPEGTRSRSGVLLEGKNGVAYLADKAGVPVVPVAVWGTETGFYEVQHLRRPTLHMRVGKPLTFPPVERRERETALQRNTEELMCQIAAMLPVEYHGAYTGHPRIAEILAERAAS